MNGSNKKTKPSEGFILSRALSLDKAASCYSPTLKSAYEFKQRLCKLLIIKERTAKGCKKLIPEFLTMIDRLRSSPLASLKTLGDTLFQWRAEIARMWRFTKTNSITEGFHNKMEMISGRAYGFRNFENYRLRVRVHCG